MSKGRFEEQWDRFRSHAPEEALEGIRAAYYSGGIDALGVLGVLIPGAEEPKGEALEALRRELWAYMRECANAYPTAIGLSRVRDLADLLDPRGAP